MSRIRNKSRLKRMFIMGLVLGAAAGILFTVLIANGIISDKEAKYISENADLTEENKTLKQQVNKQNAVENSAELLASDAENWALALVNEEHPLDTSYEPAQLTEVESERSVDSRIVDALNQMLDDAQAEGLSMYVASAYRSYDDQRTVFNETMQDWINQGYTPLNAYDETKKSVAVPGTSEHATGLCVDIIASYYQELDDAQGDTAEQQWLMEHCWEYGFILRYPEDKADITGIIYEPWHYRYVGAEAAKEIHEQDLTLEEYLAQ